MAWEITGGPYAGPWFERDSVAWVWELQRSEDDEPGRIIVEVSGTAMAVTPDSLPTETREARATQGRSEVEKHLTDDELPPLITLGTTGYITAAPFTAEEPMEQGWWAQLDGSDADLEALTELFPDEPLRIIERDGSHYLRADAFRDLADVGDVRAVAAELLRRANGAARLARGQPTNVELGHPMLVSEEGQKQHFVEFTAEVRVTASLGVEVIRADGTREHVPVDDDEAEEHEQEPQSWLTLADKDAKVAQALRLLGQNGLTWAGLYHLYEIVLADVGNRIYDEGWATQSEVERFRRTANSPAILGEHARHGRENTQPPPNPMSEDDAKQLITGVVVRWLEGPRPWRRREYVPVAASGTRFPFPVRVPPTGWNTRISSSL